jgi:hypothetical protein
MTMPVVIVGRDSSVASLRAGRSRNQVPVGERFTAPIQTGPGAHPASHTMGAGSPRPGRDINHPPPFSAAVKERVKVLSTPLLWLHERLQGEIYLFNCWCLSPIVQNVGEISN